MVFGLANRVCPFQDVRTMTLFPWRTALILALGLTGLSPRGAGAKPKAPDIPVRLGNLPDLRLAPRPILTAKQAKRIRNLIAGLAALDKPDFGLSSTLSGDAFAPVPGQSRAGVLLLTDHHLRPSENLRALVTLGPDALPFLLKALDDPTPTKITVNRERGPGAMWHAAELFLSPVNPAERAIYKARKAKPRNKEELVKSYTVQVCDVCFVAIGQIVGRGYQAVRYQPTACVVLNSPAHDPKLCAEVRAIWKAKDPRRKLFDSLRADYATEGLFNGESLDGWSLGSDLQCGAALRLLFYFEKEAAPLIAGRLAKLDVRKDREPDGFMHRCVANGVRADDFIKAVAWSKNRAVRQALTGVFRRAGDVDAMLAALPAVKDTELVRKRLEAAVDALPADEGGPYGQGFYLLTALGRRTPKTAPAVFERYLRNPSAQRRDTVRLVLEELEPGWKAQQIAAIQKLLAKKK
jgi:hypothetical protein